MGIYWNEEKERYYLDEIMFGVRVKRSLGTKDMRAATREAEKIRAEANERRRRGLAVTGEPEPDLDALVTEHGEALKALGRSEKHVEQSLKRIRRLVAGLSRLEDVTPDRISSALDLASEQGTKRENFDGVLPEGPLHPKTRNDYRACLSGFFKWLVKQGRWTHNPCVQVARARVTKRTRERRALTLDELKRLVRAAPPERSRIYWLAATTGLRRNELKLLRWSDVNEEARVIRVRAETAKNRREESQPAPADCLAALLELKGDAPSEGPVFESLPLTRTFYLDLYRAKITAGKDGKVDGGVVDFHALRATYCTLLARAGVPFMQAVKLMRHSDPKLTAITYNRLGLVDGHAAAAKLVLEERDLVEELELAATGTDGPEPSPPTLGVEVKDGNLRKPASYREGSATSANAPEASSPRRKTARGKGSRTTARLGFEPRLAGSEPAVLPLDDLALRRGILRDATRPVKSNLAAGRGDGQDFFLASILGILNLGPGRTTSRFTSFTNSPSMFGRSSSLEVASTMSSLPGAS